MGMNPNHTVFILSSNDPWNAVFSTVEGQAIYKVTSSTFARSINISRILPNITNGSSSTDDKDEQNMKDSFAHIAEIEYHEFRKSKIRYRETEIVVDEFLTKKGIGSYGRNRGFTGPDGKKYLWKMTGSSELVLDTPQKPTVAKFHHRSFGIIGKKSPASLEIFPEGNHMVELIVILLVYIEKLRRDKETTAIAADA